MDCGDVHLASSNLWSSPYWTFSQSWLQRWWDIARPYTCTRTWQQKLIWRNYIISSNQPMILSVKDNSYYVCIKFGDGMMEQNKSDLVKNFKHMLLKLGDIGWDNIEKCLALEILTKKVQNWILTLMVLNKAPINNNMVAERLVGSINYEPKLHRMESCFFINCESSKLWLCQAGFNHTKGIKKSTRQNREWNLGLNCKIN